MNNQGVDEEEEEITLRAVQLNCMLIQHYYMNYVHKTPCMVSSQTGNKWIMEVLRGHDSRCYNAFRMDKQVFYRLCSDIQVKFKTLGSNRMSHVEVVGMLLYMLGQGCGNRSAQERFQHSGETISRYFDEALDVICELGKDIIKLSDPQFSSVAPEIMRDRRYMPHFKDCIGAIDGVHVPASIAPHEQLRYIGRKGIPTQNIMAACDFDMQFTFACAGWEGSAHDTRVFHEVFHNPTMNFPRPPPGKYYVVDAGYPQMNGFLGPYRGPKQHFQQYRGRELRNKKEVFNYVHSSLRGVIERAFGVWKNKWHVLANMQGYSFVKQVKIVVATMTLHNFIRRHAHGDADFSIGESSSNMGIDMDDDAQEENDGHVAQEIETITNSIAESLMSARGGGNG